MYTISIMLLVVHIAIALLSLATSTIAIFFPSTSKIRMNGALAAMTLASGTYLVIQTRAPLASSCTTGLLYLGSVVAMNVVTYHRLVTQEQ